MTLAGGNCAIERATWTTCERNDVRRLAFQPFQFQPRWFVRRRVEKCTRIKAHEAAIALRTCWQQYDARAFVRRRVEKCTRIKAHEAAIALRTRCQQYDARAFGRRISVTGGVVGVT